MRGRVDIIRSVQTPLGFFVLVVLVVEAIFGLVAWRSGPERPDRTYLVIGMIALMFFVVGIVAFLAYSGKGLALPERSGKDLNRHSKYLLLIGPPEDMPELDIAVIEWDDDECFVIPLRQPMERADSWLSRSWPRGGRAKAFGPGSRLLPVEA